MPRVRTTDKEHDDDFQHWEQTFFHFVNFMYMYVESTVTVYIKCILLFYIEEKKKKTKDAKAYKNFQFQNKI